MLSNYYDFEFFLAYWDREANYTSKNPLFANEQVYREVSRYEYKWRNTHSKRGGFNAINLRPHIDTTTGKLNRSSFQDYLRTIFRQSKPFCFNHPFIRIYCWGHGRDKSNYFIYTLHDRSKVIVSASVFQNAIEEILVGPFGLYQNFHHSRITRSPSAANISVIACKSASLTELTFPTIQDSSLPSAKSMSYYLMHQLRELPIRCKVSGRVYAPLLPAEFDTSHREQLISIDEPQIKSTQNPAHKLVYQNPSDQEYKNLYVTESSYAINYFPAFPSFNKIYVALCILQEGSMKGAHPETFFAIIDYAHRLLNSIKPPQVETSETCEMLFQFIARYIETHPEHVQKPGFIAKIFGFHQSSNIFYLNKALRVLANFTVMPTQR